MKSLKFYKILSIVLVILNLVTIAFIYFNKPPGPPPPGEAHLANEIGLTGASKKKADALEIQHHKDKKKLTGENFRLQKRLFESLKDDDKSKEILEQISANRIETDRMTFEFFSEIADLCDASQRKELDKMIKQRLRRITGSPGRRP